MACGDCESFLSETAELASLDTLEKRQFSVLQKARAHKTDAIRSRRRRAANAGTPRRRRRDQRVPGDVCDDEEAPHKLAPRQTEQERTR